MTDWGLDLTPTEFMDDFARWPAGPFAGTIELVRGLHGTIQMACLSNSNPVHWQLHLDRWGVVDYFDWTFVSHELGLMKPDPVIFRHVIRTIGTTADRLLFLDDHDEHVMAAGELGIPAVQTRGVGEVYEALVSLLSSGLECGPRSPVHTVACSRQLSSVRARHCAWLAPSCRVL
ncbi:MAG: HAD family hydrolase [Nocardioides sp.]